MLPIRNVVSLFALAVVSEKVDEGKTALGRVAGRAAEAKADAETAKRSKSVFFLRCARPGPPVRPAPARELHPLEPSSDGLA